MNTPKTSRKTRVTAAAFDTAFERGKAVDLLDLDTVTVRAPMQRINLDLPKPILHAIDTEANRVGVPRTSMIKLWIYERLTERVPRSVSSRSSE